MRHIYIIIGVALTLVFTSCGKQHTAENLVGDFIEANAEEPSKLEYRWFGNLGQTSSIGDSVLQFMQQRKKENFKAAISYPTSTSGKLLYYLRMNYALDGDTLQNTFYFDEQMEHIVAFK